jgi:hypothetical protein
MLAYDTSRPKVKMQEEQQMRAARAGSERSAREPEVEPPEAVDFARGDVLLVGDALLVRHLLPNLLLLRVLRVGVGARAEGNSARAARARDQQRDATTHLVAKVKPRAGERNEGQGADGGEDLRAPEVPARAGGS